MKKSLQEKSNTVAKPSKEFVKTVSCTYKTKISIDIEDTVGQAIIDWELEVISTSYGVKTLNIVVPKQIISVHYFDEDLKPKVAPLELSTDDLQVNMSPNYASIIPSSLDVRQRPYQLYLEREA